MKTLAGPFQRAMAAAATLTGKRFGLLVASSLVATSAIVAAAMTSSNGSGPLAALLGRSLAANTTPALTEPAPQLEPAPGPAASPEPAPQPAASPSLPLSSPEPAPGPEPAPAPEPEPTPTTPEAPAPEAGRIKHVFVVSLASSGYDAAFGAAPQMPYLATTLRPQGTLLSGYSLLDTAALPNSVAAIGGQPPTADTKANCPDYGKCVYSAETMTLADQLTIAKFSWRAYMESMVNLETAQPDNCVYPQPGATSAPPVGGYAPQLNPFVYFHSLLDLGDCAANDVPLTELEKDLKKVKSTPSYSYISPNLCNAGVSGQCPAGAPDGAAAADTFLAALVPKILASPAYRADGLLIVSFGQANPPAVDPATGVAAAPVGDPKKVGALLLSQFVSPGSTDAAAYDPYSLLRSTEDLFGLSHLGKADGAKVKSFAPALLGENGGD
ncbi:MAG: phosphoesterase [Solirubrobacterales bacterium]|nr:phosphoesterase [Solirubrobacterales bacterium]